MSNEAESKFGFYRWDDEQKKIVKIAPSRVAVRAHYVVTDEIPPTKSMASGKIYTSKRALRAEYKRLGAIEIGNDEFPNRDPEAHYKTHEYQRQMEEDAHRAYYDVRDGMAPLSEYDKHRCEIINHNLKHYNYDRREYGPDGKPRD